jgi:hypothetical protein
VFVLADIGMSTSAKLIYFCGKMAAGKSTLARDLGGLFRPPLVAHTRRYGIHSRPTFPKKVGIGWCAFRQLSLAEDFLDFSFRVKGETHE